MILIKEIKDPFDRVPPSAKYVSVYVRNPRLDTAVNRERIHHHRHIIQLSYRFKQVSSFLRLFIA